MSIVDTFRMSSKVSEGPVVPQPELTHPDYWDDTVKPEQMPFAFQLMGWLHKENVTINFEEGPCKTGGPIHKGHGGIWHQYNVRKFLPDHMGIAIVTHCGRNVTFGELLLPKAVEYVGWSRTGNVWVRHIVSFRFASDDFRQRWDVLVRPT